MMTCFRCDREPCLCKDFCGKCPIFKCVCPSPIVSSWGTVSPPPNSSPQAAARSFYERITAIKAGASALVPKE